MLRVSILVTMPNARGRYILKPDAVVEGVRWMGDKLDGGRVVIIVRQ